MVVKRPRNGSSRPMTGIENSRNDSENIKGRQRKSQEMAAKRPRNGQETATASDDLLGALLGHRVELPRQDLPAARRGVEQELCSPLLCAPLLLLIYLVGSAPASGGRMKREEDGDG